MTESFAQAILNVGFGNNHPEASYGETISGYFQVLHSLLNKISMIICYIYSKRRYINEVIHKAATEIKFHGSHDMTLVNQSPCYFFNVPTLEKYGATSLNCRLFM